MRDQAFIVFKDLQSATAARRREDGNAFLGKRMRIQYAQSKSHATIRDQEGSEALYMVKMGIHEAKAPRLIVSGAEKANIDAEKAKKRGLNADNDDVEEEEEQDEEQPAAKKSRTQAPVQDDGRICLSLFSKVCPLTSIYPGGEEMEVESDEEGQQTANGRGVTSSQVPHNVLAVSNLPAEATSEMLTVLFQQ